MTIKEIARHLCETCSMRMGSGCPIMDSCATDVIRVDEEGAPYIAYPYDCHSCFFCQVDCPNGAVTVCAEIPMPLLAP